ncbi:MAG: 4Fe-4S dicluster domain-containing protein [Armatimonadetes bacterium]|nr:4Fe-4S dicluster domain-containing protein [Armatimonadota bacterium]
MKKDYSILKKSDVPAFFASLANEMQLIGPKQLFAGDVTFDVIQSHKDIYWDYGHVVYPPKRFLLPHFEDMFRYTCDEQIKIEPTCNPQPQAIVAIRSCDVAAIRFQENFFSYPIVDPYYKERLNNTVLFNLVCNTPPKEECFCICCDSGPWLESGFDVQLTDLGDRFLYEVGSDKGEKATEPRAYMLLPATPADIEARRQIELQADSRFQTVSYLAKAINFISADEVPAKIWEDLGSTCFRCGACTNLCPVCTCFTVDDREEPDGTFTRCRSWDSCQYAGFTREASGHNPRPTFGSRVARRFYHKTSYQYIIRDGRHGCVGCGRCITACLTKLGLPDVVKRIRREMHEFLPPKEKAAEV